MSKHARQNKRVELAAPPHRVVEAALCAWFVFVGVAFFGPSGGVSLPDATAAYAVVVLAFVATLLLRGASTLSDLGRKEKADG